MIATEVVLPLVASQLPPGIALPLMRYLQVADKGLTCATQELNTTDTTGVKTGKVAVCLANVLLPVIPPDTPPMIRKLINEIAQMISEIQGMTKVGLTVTSSTSKSFKLSAADGAKLSDLNTRATANYRAASVWLANNPPK